MPSDDVIAKLMSRKDLENPSRGEVISALKEVPAQVVLFIL